MAKPVCVVAGVGPGNGAAFARRFAADGYAVALLARQPEPSRELATALPGARAWTCDVGDAQPDDVAATAAFLVGQPRSAWTFELEARPFGETW